jgi:hypothetical protein
MAQLTRFFRGNTVSALSLILILSQRNIRVVIFLRRESSGESVGFTILEFTDISIGISMSVLNATLETEAHKSTYSNLACNYGRSGKVSKPFFNLSSHS